VGEGEGTLLDALVAALHRAADYVKHDADAPACVLWTDEKRQWEPLLPRLRERLPALLTHGIYDPEMRTGPAIWMRCMVARSLPDTAQWPDDTVPVLYLPGIGKGDLRAVETAPHELQPLAELQYRGVIWNQPQGQRDWTVFSFLSNASGGLGIEVLKDGPTQEMLLHALPALADVPLARLRAEAPLRAAWLRGLLLPDVPLALLRWLNDPPSARAALDGARWLAFAATCIEQYAFAPDRDGPLTAAASLVKREGAWAGVWGRFAESPATYPGVVDALRRAPRPPQSLFGATTMETDPAANETAETALRNALAALGADDPSGARATVRALNAEHGMRRKWVWATLGQAPLAHALVPLVRLAEATATPLAGGSVAGIVAAYASGGWKADAAALDALAGVSDGPDVGAVKGAVHALYRVWLRDAAEVFQTAVRENPDEYSPPPRVVGPPEAGVCVLFADGLRYDVGKRLVSRLHDRGHEATVTPRLAALPPVTPTAKPAVSPVAGLLGAGTGFGLVAADTGKTLNIEPFRALLVGAGYQILRGEETGDPHGAAWTEAGALDSYGHAQGWKLARRVTEEAGELADRIAALLAAGWREVRVITDHGWLLLPGGLPKAELPVGLTDEKKGRCARLKPGATWESGQSVPWHWDAAVRMAVAPGISCFEAGKEYEHGGLSPQECVTPVVTVRAVSAFAPPTAIHTVTWIGLRCRVTITGETAGCSVDIRTKPGDPASTATGGAKGVGVGGTVSLAILDDDHEGTAAHVVVIDAQGAVRAQTLTTIGGG